MALSNKEKLKILGRCKKCGFSVYDGWQHKCVPVRMPKSPKPTRGSQ
jgi:hypothetical protein